MRFFTRNKIIQPIIIFDIGSASIGGAVVFFGGEMPKISYSTRIQLPFQEEVDRGRLLPQIEEILEKVSSDVQKNGLHTGTGKSIKPHNIVCVLSSLWSNTQTTSASFENKEVFEVNDSIMDSLLEQIHKSKDTKKDGDVTIEEIVINSQLNGYSTRFPLKKEAKRIDITLLESSVAKEIYEKINNIIDKTFSPDISVVFRSSTLVAFSVARDIYEDMRDFIIVDVTGEITELAVVHNSILGDTISFPYGRNSLIRDIAKSTESVPEDILARVKILFSSIEVELEKNPFEKEEKKWIEMFSKACFEISSDINPLPKNIFLIVDSSYEKWFHFMIKKTNFNGVPIVQEDYKINPIMKDKVSDLYESSSMSMRDNFIVVDALFYNREYLSSER